MAASARFASVSSEEIEELLANKDSENTKKSTKMATTIFENYLKEKNLFNPTEPKALAKCLETFYIEARKKDGSMYSMGTLRTIRFGLSRFYKAQYGIDIITDGDFAKANKNFQAECVQMKKDGLARVDHKPAISDGDMKKLYESGVFSTETPKTLLNKVFFDVVLCFCRRGRQNLRQLKKTDFAVRINDDGVKYIAKISDEMTKNHRVDDKPEEGGSMYETGGPNCPVASFEKYIAHLHPKNEFLFQRPKKETPNDQVWYDNMVVGQRKLDEKMKDISTEAKLSQVYTNHSIRATSITILDKAGFEARHIMSVSGHKNESSIRSYSKTDESTKRKMSETLTAFARDGGNEGHSILQASSHTALTEDLASVQLPESPLLTNSQEEYLFRDVHIQPTSQIAKNSNTFYNCNVYFH